MEATESDTPWEVGLSGPEDIYPDLGGVLTAVAISWVFICPVQNRVFWHSPAILRTPLHMDVDDTFPKG